MSWEQRNHDFSTAQVDAMTAYIEAEREVKRLQDENAKLREQVQDAEHEESVAWDRVRSAERRNDRLRELVRDMWLQLLNAYDRKEVDEFADRMRELGVEA